MSVLQVINENNNNDKKKSLTTRLSVNQPVLYPHNPDKSSHNNEKHPQSTIQQIFQKSRINFFIPKDDKLFKYIKDDVESNLITVKNPYSLFNYLYTIPSFRQYTKIYNFKSQTIIDSFRLAKYVKLKKNFRLFNQGEKTDYFYLVLSGHIGFLLNSHSIKSGGPKEVNSIRAGTYFGEWGFIFKIGRTVSAYAKEDSLLLKFDKNNFKAFYQENIITSENISKKFVLKHINSFKKLGLSAFNHYYREIKKIYLEQGTPIFHQGEKANYFYLVFSGCCCIKNGYNKLIIKDVGDFFGIESFFNDIYETTIYTHSEEVVLFKFSVSTFNNDILDNLRNEFWIYYENQRRILFLWEENYKRYISKYRMNFVNLIQNIERNKLENSKILSEMSLDEIASNNRNKIKKKRYASPKKMRINFNPPSINSINSNCNYKSESVKIMTPKTSKSNKNNKIVNDIKNVYIFNQISKSPSNKMTIKLDIKDKIKNIQSQRFKSFREKYKLKLRQKHNYSYFMEDMDEVLPAYKKINMDNHFSSQNFKLKRKKIYSAFDKNKLKINIKDKKHPKNANIKNNYITSEKLEKAMKILTDNFSKNEKKSKQEYISNLLENSKNINENINSDTPIMIIRNYSFINEQ